MSDLTACDHQFFHRPETRLTTTDRLGVADNTLAVALSRRGVFSKTATQDSHPASSAVMRSSVRESGLTTFGSSICCLASGGNERSRLETNCGGRAGRLSTS